MTRKTRKVTEKAFEHPDCCAQLQVLLPRR